METTPSSGPMRDWLKGILGGSRPTPAGVSNDWITVLRAAVANGNLTQEAKLNEAQVDEAVAYILSGEGAWQHPPISARMQSYVYNREVAFDHAALCAGLGTVPVDVALRF